MKETEFRTGITIGVVIGLVLGLVGGAFAVWRWQHHEMRQIKEGWTLHPVVVFNRDAQAGERLDYDMVAKMQMPEQFVTPSLIEPAEFEKVIGLQLRSRVSQGDLVMWSHFEASAGGVTDRPTASPPPAAP